MLISLKTDIKQRVTVENKGFSAFFDNFQHLATTPFAYVMQLNSGLLKLNTSCVIMVTGKNTIFCLLIRKQDLV